MTKNNSINTLEFVNYFRSLLGVHFYFFLLVNFLVGLLDGIGLTMFIPLLGEATKTSTENYALGKLKVVPQFFEWIGIDLDLSIVLLIMIVIFSLKGLASYFRDRYFNYLTLKSILKIRYDLADQLEQLSYEGYTNINPGKIQFSLINETLRIVRAMKQFIYALQNLVILLTFFGLAFLTNWQFAILVGIGGLASNFVYKRINSLTKKSARKLSRHGNTFNDILIQTIQNFKYLKATDRIYNYKKYLISEINKFEKTQFEISNLNSLAASLREPITITVIATMMVVQMKLLGGHFATVIVSLLFFYRALTNLVSMQGNWNQFLSNAAGLDAITELKHDFRPYQEEINRNIRPLQINEIELNHISVRYNKNDILKDINLQIPNKSTLALIGESGAGKSTLANVICGLVKPTSGELLYNHRLVSVDEIHAYRQRIGYISQEPVIFSDTVYNNITFWSSKNKENLERFHQVLKLVHLEEFIQDLENGIDTYLGSNGVLISGGQKQRISIARELYKDVDMLIMDEATSALDSETEKIIQENIEKLHGKYTMIIIAHRLSTVKNADNIYLMKKGEIISQGSFMELYQTSKEFKQMVDLQEI